jgi:predicted NBD/HSP70 family sugar kinase
VRLGDYNQRVVLELVRTRAANSRAELSQRTGLTFQAISKIVRRLVAAGLVLEEASREPAPTGRPPTVLRVHPGAGYALGAHIDRDETAYVLLDLAGTVVARERRRTPRGGGPSRSADQVARVTRRLVERSGVDPDQVLGVGVGAPGPLDPVEGILDNPGGMPGWGRVHLKRMLAERTGLDVVVDNDAVAAAIGETWTGKAHDVRNLLFVYIGWGLGTALVLDGQVYRGGAGLGGDLYHVPIDPRGPLCPCGSRGCVGQYASPTAVLEDVRRRSTSRRTRTPSHSAGGNASPTYTEVCRAAVLGPSVERDALLHAATMLALGLLGVVAVVDPDLVVLGGAGLEAARPIYEPVIRRTLRDRTRLLGQREITVAISGSGTDVGAVGAASMLLHNAYAPRFASIDVATTESRGPT